MRLSRHASRVLRACRRGANRLEVQARAEQSIEGSIETLRETPYNEHILSAAQRARIIHDGLSRNREVALRDGHAET